MTIERPMFPPQRDNPFRLVGGVDVRSEPRAKRPEPKPEESFEWRGRDDVARFIRMHQDARTAYSRAALWAAQAEAEKLPPSQIDEARTTALLAGAELAECGGPWSSVCRRTPRPSSTFSCI